MFPVTSFPLTVRCFHFATNITFPKQFPPFLWCLSAMRLGLGRREKNRIRNTVHDIISPNYPGKWYVLVRARQLAPISSMHVSTIVMPPSAIHFTWFPQSSSVSALFSSRKYWRFRCLKMEEIPFETTLVPLFEGSTTMSSSVTSTTTEAYAEYEECYNDPMFTIFTYTVS